jgi:N utilization substance protein A
MSEISNAIKTICDEKGLSYDAVIETIESALAAAYRKDFGKKNQNIKVQFDPETGKSKVYDVKLIVEDLPEEVVISEEEAEEIEKAEIRKSAAKIEEKIEIEKIAADEAVSADAETGEEVRKFNPKTEMQLKDAKAIKKTAKIGDEIKMKLDIPDAYGRMAAQTAKQVIIQRLREAEREMIFNDFKDKEKEVVSGVIQRREGRIVLIDLGRSVGVLPYEEQIPGEQYRPGERIKVYVKEVSLKPKGPEILLSRTSDEILKKVFYLEIPEISNGLIDIKNVAREAGSRSKVAVWTDSDNVDPIGSCVGQRGARIQTIIHELGGEKVDIIQFDDDPVKYISNALSPAKIIGIELDDKSRKATVMVASEQLSLAIGKGGQNARLAARLTGWKVDIVEAPKLETPKKEKETTAENTEEKNEDNLAAEDATSTTKEKTEDGAEKEKTNE